MSILIGRTVLHLIERCAELDTPLTCAHRQVVAAAVLRTADLGGGGALEALYTTGAELGRMLTARALKALDCAGGDIQSFGKAALVGTGVPLEWAAALLHPQLGRAVRDSLPGAISIMPSVAKRGPAGACLDIPLHSVTDMWSFDHFDTVSLCVPDSPAPDEILIAVALAERGRPLARIRAS